MPTKPANVQAKLGLAQPLDPVHTPDELHHRPAQGWWPNEVQDKAVLRRSLRKESPPEINKIWTIFAKGWGGGNFPLASSFQFLTFSLNFYSWGRGADIWWTKLLWTTYWILLVRFIVDKIHKIRKFEIFKLKNWNMVLDRMAILLETHYSHFCFKTSPRAPWPWKMNPTTMNVIMILGSVLFSMGMMRF